MEDPFKAWLLFVLFGVPICFGILAGLGSWLGSKTSVRSNLIRALLGTYQLLSLIGIPFLLMLFQDVSATTEAMAFAVWIFTLGFAVKVTATAKAALT
jgi:predicted MFS family arabinose efflux permease